MCVLLIQCLKGRTPWMKCVQKSDHAHSARSMPPLRSVPYVYIVVLSLSLGSTQILTLPVLCIPGGEQD